MGLIDRLLGRTPEQAFAGEVATVLRRSPQVTAVERGRRDLELRVTRQGGSGGEGIVNLDALFREVQGLRQVPRRAAINRFVKEVVIGDVRMPGAWPHASDRLFPAVRPAGFTGGLGGELRPVTWPVAPFLVELLAYDDGERMAFLHDESLARLGVTADAARLAAHGNLTKPGLAVVQAEGIAGAWAIAGPSSYQSSWLAAHTWLAGTAAARVEGDPLVVAPTRDQAMVLGSADPATVAAVLRWAEVAYGDGARPLSPVLYRLDRRRLAPWVPDADHPCRPRVERSGRILAFQEYSAQREHLQPLFDAAGDDMYVGEIGLHERPGGGVFTWTTWSALVDDALMPPADYVRLVAADGDGFWVAWDALQSEAGDLLTEEPGWGLPRHRAGAWPDPARLARLRARATDPFTS